MGKAPVCIQLNSCAPNILKWTLFYPTAIDVAKGSPNAATTVTSW